MKLVPVDADTRVAVTAPLTHLCPFVDETDHGTITITWHTEGFTLELHALAAYLTEWADSRVSHEELTDRIRHDLATLPGIRLISVETTWTTAGMEVRCSTSPTPAGATP